MQQKINWKISASPSKVLYIYVGFRLLAHLTCDLSQAEKKWYFVIKIILNYCEKNCSSDREKLLKFEAEGREFTNFLRSLEQFVQTVKSPKIFWKQNAFLTCS